MSERKIWKRGVETQQGLAPAQKQMQVKPSLGVGISSTAGDFVDAYMQRNTDPKLLEQEQARHALEAEGESADKKSKLPKRHVWQGVGADAKSATHDPRDKHRSKAQKVMLGRPASGPPNVGKKHDGAKRGARENRKRMRQVESSSSEDHSEDGKSSAFGK